MMNRFGILMVMLLSASIRLSAGNDIVFYNANIVDTDKGEVRYNQTVTVRNGLIVSSEPSAARVRPGEMNMTGKFLMPGLIDSHVHYANACRDASSAKSLSELFLKNGVTTVRDVGGNYLFIKEYDRMRQSGELAGPEIYYSSIWAEYPFAMPAVHAVGADSENNPWSRMFSIKDSTDISLEKAVREAYEVGCTGFKLYINYSADDLKRLIPYIRKYGMKVWGHSSQINGADAMQVAASGIDVMSHAYLIPRHYYPAREMSATDREYTSRVLDQMLKNNVVLDVTLKLSQGSGTYFASEIAKMAYQKGVKLVVGTDLPGCEIHNEMEILSRECEIADADILRAATVNGAEILGMKGRLGLIAEGAEADIIVLEENPLTDISALRRIIMTVSDGAVVYRRPSSVGSMNLHNCNVVDVESGKILKRRTIRIKDGIICEISRSSASSPSAEDIDLAGKYVMPGLIDSHVHWGAFTPTDEIAESISKDFLAAGVTTVRDMGSNVLNIKKYNARIKEGAYSGPRVFYSALWAAGDYFMDPGDAIGWEGEGEPPWSRKINISNCTDAQLEQAVLDAKAVGCSGFKLYINYSEEDLRRVIPIMKRNGMKVWSHATQVKGADALQVAGSGVDVVSHAYMLCNDITSRERLSTDELVYLKKVCKTLRSNGVALDATAHISLYEGQMQYSREIISEAYRSGVKIIAGTDFYGNAIYDELVQLVSAGMSEADVLKAATASGAEVLGMKGKLGVVKKGAVADLLILDADPLDDISALKGVRTVIMGGVKQL